MEEIIADDIILALFIVYFPNSVRQISLRKTEK